MGSLAKPVSWMGSVVYGPLRTLANTNFEHVGLFMSPRNPKKFSYSQLNTKFIVSIFCMLMTIIS